MYGFADQVFCSGLADGIFSHDYRPAPVPKNTIDRCNRVIDYLRKINNDSTFHLSGASTLVNINTIVFTREVTVFKSCRSHLRMRKQVYWF
ncbi:hypothetical protein YC2023_020323 [Brassica napus]